jgi:hypothetical protein
VGLATWGGLEGLVLCVLVAMKSLVHVLAPSAAAYMYMGFPNRQSTARWVLGACLAPVWGFRPRPSDLAHARNGPGKCKNPKFWNISKVPYAKRRVSPLCDTLPGTMSPHM